MVMLVLGKALGKSILDSPLLVSLPMLGVLLIFSIDLRFSIVSSPAWW